LRLKKVMFDLLMLHSEKNQWPISHRQNDIATSYIITFTQLKIKLNLNVWENIIFTYRYLVASRHRHSPAGADERDSSSWNRGKKSLPTQTQIDSFKNQKIHTIISSSTSIKKLQFIQKSQKAKSPS
jgi:hypothetical protein